MSTGCCIDREDCWLSWEGEDAILNFSDKFLEEWGWKEGDEIEFDQHDDGAIIMRRVQNGEINEQTA